MSEENKPPEVAPVTELAPGRFQIDSKTGLALDASAPMSKPAQGGWVPPVWLPILFVVIGGALSTALTIVQGPWLIAVQVGLGIVTSLGAAFGIQSAGPRKP